MKFINTQDLKDGDKLICTIYSPNGAVMLREGVILTDRLIKHIQKHHINGVYIEDENLKGVIIDSGIEQMNRMQFIEKLRIAFQEVEKNGRLTLAPLMKVSSAIVDTLVSKPDFIVQLKDIRTKELYLYAHSINVCMLSILTAKALGYNMIQINQVALGALLHDIGYAFPDLKDPLIEHTKKGFNLLRSLSEMPLLSSHMAFQHHETVTGMGFPRGIKGEAFLEYAQICAIANEYDVFINGMSGGHLPHEGVDFIMSKAENTYDIKIVRAFVQNIAPYPIGSELLLNDKNVGVVSHVERGNTTRPIIKLKTGELIDLAKEHTIFIEKVLI